MIGKARCPGSCGEIVQGVVGTRNFLITCPIALYSEVSVELSIEKSHFVNSINRHNRADNLKAHRAAQKTLEYFGAGNFSVTIAINSQIPRGIGLSSSTADITATCLAVSAALGEKISPAAIADIALSIEPSDGIMYGGVMIFDHIEGKWREKLGELPGLEVYIIDTGEMVDTRKFNNREDLKELNMRKEPQVREALELARNAFNKNDINLLGDAMIKSALAHQRILFKPHLSDIIEIGEKYNALGVNVAHSGSAIGVFFRKDYILPKEFFSELNKIMKKHRKNYRIIRTKTDSSGPRVLIGKNNKCGAAIL
jgi:L-threonine kinase